MTNHMRLYLARLLLPAGYYIARKPKPHERKTKELPLLKEEGTNE